MKYRVSYRIKDTEDNEVIPVNCMVEIAESGAFKYGNGKALGIRYDNGWDNEYFDIRYDKTYSAENEREYVKRFIQNRYSGTRKAQYINIKAVFALG